MPGGVSTDLGTLVGFHSVSGQRLYSPCLHSFFCNAMTVCQGFLGIFLFCLLPPGGPQFGGRCFSFVAIPDGAGDIFDRSFFEFVVCTSSTVA